MGSNEGYERRRESWLWFLDKWCEKHGITRKQAASILCGDSAYNKYDPQDPLVTYRDLFWSEMEEFGADVLESKCEREENAQSTDT